MEGIRVGLIETDTVSWRLCLALLMIQGIGVRCWTSSGHIAAQLHNGLSVKQVCGTSDRSVYLTLCGELRAGGRDVDFLGTWIAMQF